MSCDGGRRPRTVERKQPLLTGCFENDFVGLPVGVRLAARGVDTVSFCWRPQDWKLWLHLERPLKKGTLLQGWDERDRELLGSSEVFRGARGSAHVKERFGGAHWGYFPNHTLIYCEGHLASILSGSDKDTGLASSGRLDNGSALASLRASEFLHPHGLLDETPHVRRLDLACDLQFDDPRQGQIFMRGLAAMDLPRLKRNVWHEHGEIQTVYFRTPARKQIKLRVYDKSIESATGPAGSWVRIEQQFRFSGKQQPNPSEITDRVLAGMWAKPLEAWTDADDFLAADADALQAKVMREVEAGRLEAYKAERIIGHLAMRSAGVGRDWWKRNGKPHLWSRREAELRELGVAVDEINMSDAAGFPMGEVLRVVRGLWGTPEASE